MDGLLLTIAVLFAAYRVLEWACPRPVRFVNRLLKWIPRSATKLWRKLPMSNLGFGWAVLTWSIVIALLLTILSAILRTRESVILAAIGWGWVFLVWYLIRWWARRHF